MANIYSLAQLDQAVSKVPEKDPDSNEAVKNLNELVKQVEAVEQYIPDIRDIAEILKGNRDIPVQREQPSKEAIQQDLSDLFEAIDGKTEEQPSKEAIQQDLSDLFEAVNGDILLEGGDLEIDQAMFEAIMQDVQNFDNLLQGGATGKNHSDAIANVRFEPDFNTSPALIDKLDSFQFSDTTSLYPDNISRTNFGIGVYEELSLDTEFSYTQEPIPFLALGGSGSLEGLAG
ncbi:MAG: hypothetical protein AAFW75_04305 [Cyanobacteria bacterium J06636_16]